MSFDARDLKLLQPGTHLTSGDYPGLRVEASASRRTWVYRYRSPVDQRLRQIKVGTWPAMSVHAAIAAWEQLRQARDAGRDPALEARERKTAVRQAAEASRQVAKGRAYTVSDVADDYWHGHIVHHRQPKGQAEIRRMFDTMLGDAGKIPAAELTRAQAFDLIKGHADVRPVVAGYLRAELGAAWDYAIDAGRLPETCPNWWRLILRGRLKSKGKKIGGEHVGTAKRALTEAEVATLIRWLPNFSQLVDDALTMYLWTACRGVEILTMEGRDVRQESGGQWWWVIPKEKTKNARHANAGAQRVPLFGRALAIVLRRRDLHGDGWLFPARRRDGKAVPVEQKTIQSAVWFAMPYSTTRPDEQRPRLPVTHWAPHDLRRTARTILAALGCPTEVAESILGHMLPGVQGVYNVHAYDGERVVWLGRLSAHLEGLVGGAT